MKKFVSFLLALMMIFWSSTLAFATDKTDTQNSSTSDESDGGSMPTDFVDNSSAYRRPVRQSQVLNATEIDRNDYDEPDDDTEEEI